MAPAKKSARAKARAKGATVPRTGAGTKGGKHRRARVPEDTAVPVPDRAMKPGPARPSPWPAVNAKATKGAPEGREPTPKRRAKAVKAAKKAHRNRTNWI